MLSLPSCVRASLRRMKCAEFDTNGRFYSLDVCLGGCRIWGTLPTSVEWKQATFSEGLSMICCTTNRSCSWCHQMGQFQPNR